MLLSFTCSTIQQAITITFPTCNPSSHVQITKRVYTAYHVKGLIWLMDLARINGFNNLWYHQILGYDLPKKKNLKYDHYELAYKFVRQDTKINYYIYMSLKFMIWCILLLCTESLVYVHMQQVQRKSSSKTWTYIGESVY